MGKFDIFVKTFWKQLRKGYKITSALNSSVGSFCFLQNFYCLYSSLGSAASSLAFVEFAVTADPGGEDGGGGG